MISTSIPADTSLYKSHKRAGGLIAGGWRWRGKEAHFSKNVILCPLVLSICVACGGVYKHCNPHHSPQWAKLLIMAWEASLPHSLSPSSRYAQYKPHICACIQHCTVYKACSNLLSLTSRTIRPSPRWLTRSMVTIQMKKLRLRNGSNHTPHQCLVTNSTCLEPSPTSLNTSLSTFSLSFLLFLSLEIVIKYFSLLVLK